MRTLFDPFMLAMFAAIGLSSAWPASGDSLQRLQGLSSLAVGLLFFLHGAAIAPRDLMNGVRQWRLHALIFALTFAVFPLLVLPFSLAPPAWMPDGLATGFVYLGVLPSAVSSSIAFTAMARGNVPGAICSAAASNVFGLLLTPILLGLLTKVSGGGALDPAQALKDVCLGLLLPFAAGQALRPALGGWLDRNSRWLGRYDQSVIVLVIFVAFSQSAGIWADAPWPILLVALALCVLLLAAIFVLAMVAARAARLSREDEIAAVFCGSKKSLASGLPLAQILFAGSAGFGLIVLPIILYNQVQIVFGAVMAKRYAARPATPALGV